MRHRLMVLVMLAAIGSPAIARAQPTPQTAAAAPPARGPVVVRKTDVIHVIGNNVQDFGRVSDIEPVDQLGVRIERRCRSEPIEQHRDGDNCGRPAGHEVRCKR
jgi:hypothetical protein